MKRRSTSSSWRKGAGGAELIGGLHAVRLALRSGRVEALWIEKGRRDRRIRALVEEAGLKGIAPAFLDKAGLEALLPGIRHQGVIARVRPVAEQGEGALEALLQAVGTPFLLVLDGVQDPHNLGACLRTACAAGACGLILPRRRAAGLTPAAVKVASGGAECVPLFRVTNLARTLDGLKERGIRVVGLAGEAGACLYEADLTGPLALVLGGEEKGLRRLTRERCHLVARIPMEGGVESLNVSVAAGIALFEARRQRGACR